MAVRVSCAADQRESVGAVRVGCGSVPITWFLFSRNQAATRREGYIFIYL